jgi:hypothetical protein
MVINYYDNERTANCANASKLWIICHVKIYVWDIGQRKSEGVVIILRAISAARYVMYLLNGMV